MRVQQRGILSRDIRKVAYKNKYARKGIFVFPHTLLPPQRSTTFIAVIYGLVVSERIGR
jgi:hypothetical protein